jgi:tRNA (Thr-GGU) A37 N-methylase
LNEVDALDGASVFDIKTRYDTFSEHNNQKLVLINLLISASWI